MKNRVTMKLDARGFVSGFFNGLAAPALLFCEPEEPRYHFNEFKRLYKPAPSAQAALEGDLRKIGKDFTIAIKSYEQKA